MEVPIIGEHFSGRYAALKARFRKALFTLRRELPY